MPWVPITAQAHDEKRPEIAADGLRVPETGTVENVPKAGDLSDWAWDQYRLESGLSGKLGFGVASIEASYNTRTLVAEFSRSKTIATDETNACFGVAARLIVNVRGLDAKANLTLPFVAAEAQYNRAESYANLRVSGYVGPEVGKMFPEFSTFDIESYVKLMQSLSEMREVIGAKEEHIRPTRLWAWAEEEAGATDRRLTEAVGTLWALTQIADGHPREEALGTYRDQDDTAAQAAIEQTYAEMLQGDEGKPSKESRARARRLLDGYELHHPPLGIGMGT
jgi:hypothetical protein